MTTMNVYLNFAGQTEEAFNFYKSVFGGEFIELHRYSEMPGGACGDASISDADKDKIMHVSYPLGTGTILMGTDTLASMGQQLVMGNNFSISMGTDSEAETTTLFNALAVGGKVTMPLQKTFWNSFFGMLTDKFGVQWMFNYDYTK